MSNTIASVQLKPSLSDLVTFKDMSLDETKTYLLSTLNKDLLGLSKEELIHRTLERSIDTYAVDALLVKVENANAFLVATANYYHPQEPSPEPICIIEYLGLNDIYEVCALHMLAMMTGAHQVAQPQSVFGEFFDKTKMNIIRDCMLDHKHRGHAGFTFGDLVYTMVSQDTSTNRLRPSHVQTALEMRDHVDNVFSIVWDIIDTPDRTNQDNDTELHPS